MRLGNRNSGGGIVVAVMWLVCAVQAPGPVLTMSAFVLPLWWLLRRREGIAVTRDEFERASAVPTGEMRERQSRKAEAGIAREPNT